MIEKVRKLLKEKIGTAFTEHLVNDKPYLILSGYGRNIIVLPDFPTNSDDIGNITKILHPSKKLWAIEIACDHPNYDEYFVYSIKIMIELIKRSE